MYKYYKVLVLLFALNGPTVYAQTFDTTGLDALLDSLNQKDKAMVSIAISKNGKLLYKRAIGQAVLSETGNVPANSGTRYRIGSITKTFTATIIFQLIDEKKLSLATTLDHYYPQVKNARTITIGNLLNHRSGIHNFTNDAAYWQYMTFPKTQAEMLEIIAATKPDFEPNARTEYSNANYVLLGYIIEKITKQSYAQNLASRITEPLNLKATQFGGKTDIRKQESYSYKRDKKWVKQPETDLSIPAGAGAMLSTPSDLTLFMTALLQGKLTSAESLVHMKTMVDDVGMGLFRVPFYNKFGFGHGGNLDGFASLAYYLPEGEYAVAICSNGIAYPLNDLLIAVLSTCYNMPVAMPSFKTISISPQELDKFTGLYSSKHIPLKITVTRKDSTLIAQATGQAPFELTPTEKFIFIFDAAGITIEFDPEGGQFILKQGMGNYLYTKEK